jgi:hypothetical protein
MAVTLSCGDNGALGPPISVLTHPGLTKTQVMPRGAKSIAALRITIFTAELAVRQIEAAFTASRDGGDAPSATFYEAQLPEARALAQKLVKRGGVNAPHRRRT